MHDLDDVTVFVFFTCKSVKINAVSLSSEHDCVCYCCSEFEGCRDSKKSDLILEDFGCSGVLNIPILSTSLLECLPAWPHLLN